MNKVSFDNSDSSPETNASSQYNVPCMPHMDATEESSIKSVEPYKTFLAGEILFWIFVILSGGLYYLIDYWFLCLHLFLRYKRVPTSEATMLVIKTMYFVDLIPTRQISSKGLGTVLSFTHHNLRYYYDGKCVQPLYFNSTITYSEIIDNLIGGYNYDEEVTEKRNLFGKCEILIQLQSFLSLTFEEIKHPFYLFQLFSVILWFLELYYVYAVCVFVITLISLLSSTYQSWKSMHDLHDLALRYVTIKVKRGGEWTTINSEELVPGDLIEIPRGTEMPCDAILISGGAVVEESSLTGESVPVIKDALPYLNDKVYSVEIDRHFSLYEGTKVLQTRNHGEKQVIGLVVRTGFSTMKGKMVRSILFPKPNKFKFTRDSLRFIGCLALVALSGFAVSIYLFISTDVATDEAVIGALDLITIAIPPALPACMNIGTGFALHRLKKQGIFCISYPRINAAGRIDVFCFDKTGTLTEDGMNLLGVNVSRKGKMSELHKSAEQIEKNKRRFLTCLATCHSLTYVNDKLVGDPQDLEIFKFSGFKYSLPKDEGSEVKAYASLNSDSDNKNEENYDTAILHIFYFTSKRKRMGVIVKNLQNDNFEFYMKGAPEIVLERCRKSSIPDDIEHVLDNYTRSGYRVLACAMNSLNTIPAEEMKAQKLENLEQEMSFLGLLVLQNKLKAQTIPTIKILQKAEIETVMSTGDAVLTAISVAKECHIIKKDATVFLAEMVDNEIVWEKFTNEADDVPKENILNEPPWLNADNNGDYTLAVTGAVLNAYDALAKLNDTTAAQSINILLKKCRIFARMSPEHKTLLISRFQEIGIMVGMCGDGANDCGALKTADIGISLTEAETSIAAPFTSSIPDISCVPIVLQNGRCALTTSVQCFKYMAVYSMIQFTNVQILYVLGSGLTNNEFLSQDLITVLPLAMAMGSAGPYHKLSKKQPISSLMSVAVIGSVIGHSILQTIGMVVVYEVALSMPYFTPVDDASDDYLNDANTIVYLMALLELISVCIAFNEGRPWKKPAYKNVWFMVYISLIGMLHVYLVLWPPQWLMDLYNIDWFPMYMRLALLGIWLAYSVVAFVYERFVIVWIYQRHEKWKRNKRSKNALESRVLKA
ncbi:unnamed protein product [Blepharisma stoltei]|uniref:Cation-transporting ATPase n=1 Tax=Blepharisma stoltei TaxID=1481888 RepID=A0AAU9IP60_9CILI|nr:unnamed protein product [Blepharisma stoltei]